MARPRKLEPKGEMVMTDEYLPEVKFVILPIALSGGTDSGAVNIREADAVASEWIAKGYELVSVLRGEFIANDRAQVICVFVRKYEIS